ncbi:MAG: hypothetical protein MAG715_00280 [Methanonatronarchaeales archaeon]|nr:hypothetical protein [Methanonatronarchaeales archaeon]
MVETLVDDHLHLSPKGKPEDAVRDFEDEGGTHLFSPNLLPATYGVEISEGEDYREVFERHVELVESVSGSVEVFPLVGVHPVEVPRLAGEMGLEAAGDVVSAGLDVAAGFVRDGRAVAIGEVGRPHYDVPEAVVEACDRLLRKAFRLAAAAGCAVQLHTERMDGPGVEAVASVAKEEGLGPGGVVHHFSPPLIDECGGAGTVPSVLARSDFVEEAASRGDRFLLETDYLDDPGRPGAVLGPGTVPARTADLLERGVLSEAAAERVHRKLPEEVYGVRL